MKVGLTGPNDNGLALCAEAQKLDPGNATITLSIGASSSGNSTAQFGVAQACAGVAP